jgi:WD40 repeat protein
MVAFGTVPDIHPGTVYTVDVNNRRKLDGGVKRMSGTHAFGITALHFLDTPFEETETSGRQDNSVNYRTMNLISGDAMGNLLFHDAKTGYTDNLRIRIKPQLHSLRKIIFIDCDPLLGLVVVGMSSGEVWTTGSEKLRRVEGTEFVDTDWEVPPTVRVDADIFYLTDFPNAAVFVARETSIKRYGLATSSTTVFKAPDCGNITCASIDPESNEKGKPRLLAIGDANGTVYIYNAASPSKIVSPLYTVTPVPDVKLTALAINALIIVTGSNDGTAKVYSTLNGDPLRTLCGPNSRHRRLRPPPGDNTNPITSISLPRKLKSQVRGVIAFKAGQIRYWDFAPNGVGVVLRRKKRARGLRARELRGFVDDEVAREGEDAEVLAAKRKRWEKMNGGIQEEDVALQVALMMSREEEERRYVGEVKGEEGIGDEGGVDDDVWLPGRKISFGNTSGSGSPGVRLQDVAVFKKGRSGDRERQFDEDLELAIRLSLAEQESREATPGVKEET